MLPVYKISQYFTLKGFSNIMNFNDIKIENEKN